jgi:hypothetical protein
MKNYVKGYSRFINESKSNDEEIDFLYSLGLLKSPRLNISRMQQQGELIKTKKRFHDYLAKDAKAQFRELSLAERDEVEIMFLKIAAEWGPDNFSDFTREIYRISLRSGIWGVITRLRETLDVYAKRKEDGEPEEPTWDLSNSWDPPLY